MDYSAVMVTMPIGKKQIDGHDWTLENMSGRLMRCSVDQVNPKGGMLVRSERIT